MNTITVLGIALILLGLVGLVYGGITYTSSKNVVDMGSMHVQVDQERHIPLSPIVGAASMVAGIVVILIGRRQQARSRAT